MEDKGTENVLLPLNDKRTVSIRFPVSPAEKKWLQQQAKKKNLTLTGFLRQVSEMDKAKVGAPHGNENAKKKKVNKSPVPETKRKLAQDGE
jgi:predicted metal-dependent phosphoesterase TrpH